MASTITFNDDKPWSLARVRNITCKLKLADYYHPFVSMMGGGFMSFYVLPSTDVLAVFTDQASNVKRYFVLTSAAFDEVVDSADNEFSAQDSGYAYHCGLFNHSERLAYFDSESMISERTRAYREYIAEKYANRR